MTSQKGRYLSKEGKLTLIRNVQSALPIYYISIFFALMEIIQRQENNQSDFIYNGSNGKKKLHLRNWDHNYRTLNQGGLGIKSLKSMNQALLRKRLWRFGEERSKLWTKAIAEKYGVLEDGWSSKCLEEPYGSGLWKGIMKLSHPFLMCGARVDHWS